MKMFSIHLAIGIVLAMSTRHAEAAERIAFRRDGERREVIGELVVRAEDGGRLVRAADGLLWTIQPDEILDQQADDAPCVPLDKEGMIERLKSELPGFEYHTTSHFIIAYNTTKAYAQWYGSLHERLYNGFFNYWRRRGAKITDPDWPLVAVVFSDQADYAEYSKDELGAAATSIVGYYSLRTNRVVTYDLTGSQKIRTTGPRPNGRLQINRLLAQPSAAPTVATVIHEATHQLAYNSGLQRRYADNPLWLSEGIAMFFETPDLNSNRSWRGIGSINHNRLNQMRKFMPERQSTSLRNLLATDERVRDGETAVNAYAESWALCHFLLKRKPNEFVAFLAEYAEKTPLVYDTPQQRLLAFQRHFGSVGGLDVEFQRYVERMR